MFTIIINTKFCVYFRKEELEMRDARIAVVPLIVAEQQRMWVHCSCGWEHKYTMNSWHIWCHDGLFFLLSCTVVSKFNMLNSDTFHVCWVIAILSLSTKLCFAQGTAQWLEHWTCDWKVAGSNPCRSGGRIFFSMVYGVHRKHALRQQQFHVAPAMPALKYTTSVDIQKTCYKKLVTHVEPHASAVSLLKRAENSAI